MIPRARTSSQASRTHRSTADDARALKAWRDRALEVPGDVLSSSVPLDVLLAEAAQAAASFDRRWKPSSEGPGLESAASPAFTADAGRDLRALCEAIGQARVEHALQPAPEPSRVAEARPLLRAITATLEWYFAGHEDEAGRAQLAALRAARARRGRSASAEAASLGECASLAEAHRAGLRRIGGFDPTWIEQARALAAAIRERKVTQLVEPAPQRAALALRNKLVALLRDRLATLRAAARFVFRDHPAILREFTSSHERKRRRAARAAKRGSPPQGVVK